MPSRKERASYKPVEGSLADMVIAFYQSNPDEELTLADIADKFGFEKRQVPIMLAQAVYRGPLERTRNYADEEVWRLRERGSFRPWPLVHGKNGGARKRRPAAAIDFSALHIERNVPLFERPTLVKQLVPFLARLKKDDHFKLPVEARGVATTARSAFCKAHPGVELAIRQISKTQIGVWRTN